MSFEEDEEIVQDFLVEAGEILDNLGEQLVGLEQTPDDSDLLNAVFRGFHTIKGGASFIALTALVDVCHIAEDTFNQLRQGERAVDAHLMDVMLRVVDVLNVMFDEVRAGGQPTHADAALIQDLKGLLIPAGAAPAAPKPAPVEAVAQETIPVASVETVPVTETETVSDDITDQEFEQLLDALDGELAAEPAAQAVAESDDINEDEFDALLNELHGGGAPGMPSTTTETAQPIVSPAVPSAQSVIEAGSDDISEDEFDALLDELHGGGPVKSVSVPEPDTQVAAVAVPEKVAPAPEIPEPVNAPAVVIEPPTKPAVAKDKDNDKTPPAAKDAAAQAETTVRVDTKRLDDIMNMVGELVLVRNRLVTLEASLDNEEVSQTAASLDLVTADLQSAVMKTRMQPIKKVFGRFPRVVRDLARSLSKEVNLELQGEDTDLDKNLVEALADPLVHLVRNAVDHGIEMPDVREANGKSRAGTVVLSAEQEGDHILLSISDDGGGMDPDILRGIAVKKGIMDADAAARLDNREAFNLIFAPGFSTKEVISDVSGRGVGMDVVKTRIVQLNGTVDIDSRLGEGTRLSIKVPLTLAIMPTLMVMLNNQTFALPLVSVNEIFNLDLTDTNRVDGQEVIMLRNQPLPIYFLKDWLVKGSMGEEHPKSGHVVVVTVGNQKAGFVVEQLVGQEEVVIKPLGRMLQGTLGLSGATITGDGKIALILDVPSLMKAYARKR
ncbi:MAG: chemotaxis protein CheA [Gammaproteobacteria bacterium]|nr:chemotaxis protein CheA [Gammaproteobacteria bacterium]